MFELFFAQLIGGENMEKSVVVDYACPKCQEYQRSRVFVEKTNFTVCRRCGWKWNVKRIQEHLKLKAIIQTLFGTETLAKFESNLIDSPTGSVLPTTVKSAFAWQATPEGVLYWENISMLLGEY